MLEPDQPKQEPRCPECGGKMKLCVARKHPYFLCVGMRDGRKKHEPVQLGIKGEKAWFQFKKLVDLETMKIIDNPYFSIDKHRRRMT